jgi:hypothetical protein
MDAECSCNVYIHSTDVGECDVQALEFIGYDAALSEAAGGSTQTQQRCLHQRSFFRTSHGMPDACISYRLGHCHFAMVSELEVSVQSKCAWRKKGRGGRFGNSGDARRVPAADRRLSVRKPFRIVPRTRSGSAAAV